MRGFATDISTGPTSDYHPSEGHTTSEENANDWILFAKRQTSDSKSHCRSEHCCEAKSVPFTGGSINSARNQDWIQHPQIAHSLLRRPIYPILMFARLVYHYIHLHQRCLYLRGRLAHPQSCHGRDERPRWLEANYTQIRSLSCKLPILDTRINLELAGVAAEAIVNSILCLMVYSSSEPHYQPMD